MANVFESLQAAIVAKFNSITWLKNNTAGLYFNQADESTPLPFCAFFLDADYNPYASGRSAVIKLQFNSFSDKKSSKEINDINSYIKSAFENTSLTLTGGYVNSMAPQVETEMIFKNDTNDWQGTLIFKLRVE